MSLVLQIHQTTKQPRRLLYIDNNVAEYIESHGISMIDNQRYYYSHHKSLKKPFNNLPKDYEKLDLEHQIFVYDVARIHQYEVIKNE